MQLLLQLVFVFHSTCQQNSTDRVIASADPEAAVSGGDSGREDNSGVSEDGVVRAGPAHWK